MFAGIWVKCGYRQMYGPSFIRWIHRAKSDISSKHVKHNISPTRCARSRIILPNSERNDLRVAAYCRVVDDLVVDLWWWLHLWPQQLSIFITHTHTRSQYNCGKQLCVCFAFVRVALVIEPKKTVFHSYYRKWGNTLYCIPILQDQTRQTHTQTQTQTQAIHNPPTRLGLFTWNLEVSMYI